MNTAEEEDFRDDDMFEHHRIVVDKRQQPIRIDHFLMDRLPNVTRTKLQAGIHAGFVRINERIVKPNYKLRPADVIVVSLPEPPRESEVIPENIPLEIIFEDEHLLIVNKVAGMVVHPAHQNWTGTLVNALAYHFQHLPELPGNDGKPGLVHRIDKDTSGLLVIAKNEVTLTGLAKQFFDHSIEREYWALVWGTPNPTEGTIRVPLGRSPKDRRITIGTEEGKQAVTHYKLIEDFRYVSLVECRLETGRTHQIRAHMNHIGHPLFADSMYGGMEIKKGAVFTKYKQFVDNCFKIMPRQALHARTLGFIHPISKEKMKFEVEVPEDFRNVLEKWDNYVKYN